jgi:hypothetical protein
VRGSKSECPLLALSGHAELHLQTVIYLASSPDVAKATGQYFYKSVPIRPSSWAKTTDLLYCSGSAARHWPA